MANQTVSDTVNVNPYGRLEASPLQLKTDKLQIDPFVSATRPNHIRQINILKFGQYESILSFRGFSMQLLMFMVGCSPFQEILGTTQKHGGWFGCVPQ